MKKKKILITLLSLLSIGVSFVVGGCKNIENSSDPSGSGVSEEDNLPAEVLLNGFDSVADVYRVKQMIPVNCNFVGSLRVSKEIKKSGDGSLKVQYQETDGDIGEIIQRINQTDASERDVADIKQVSLWVYNDNTETASVNVNMLKSSNTVFLTTTVQLPPKEWTECVLDVNKVVLEANVNGFQGFSIEFNYKSLPATFYVDEWKVAFGAEYSEEDNVYLNKVAEIESDIGKIEGTLSENDLALMKKIGLAYDELPAEYKNSINNFVDYKKYITSVYKEKKEISNGTKDITTAYFNEFYGLSQVSMLNAASASLSYSEKVKYNGEGTLHIDCNGSDFSSVNIEANGNFKAYEKISFNVFNAWTENIVIWLNWQKSITSTADWTEIPAGEWVEFEVYTDSIPDNFLQLEISTETHNGCKADIYVSKMLLQHKATAEEVNVAIDGLPNVTADLIITEETKQAYVAAKTLFDSFDGDTALIGEERVGKLTAMGDYISACEVKTLIGGLPAAETLSVYTTEIMVEVNRIKAKMVALNENAKSYITADEKERLNALYEKLSVLVEDYDRLSLCDLGYAESLNLSSSWDYAYGMMVGDGKELCLTFDITVGAVASGEEVPIALISFANQKGNSNLINGIHFLIYKISNGFSVYGEVQGTNSGKQFGIFNEKIEFTFEEGKTYQIQIGYIFDEENATLSAYLGVSDENGEIDRITGVANLDEGQLTLVKNMLSKGDYVFFQNGEVKNVVYNDAYNK